MSYALLITCEHAGNIIPNQYQLLFAGQDEVLASHEGWDPGAWDVAAFLGEQLNAKPIGCPTSRLLIEANRSLHHPQLFSRFTNSLNEKEKEALIKEIYLPYRKQVERKIAASSKPLLHLSIHSFTPVFHGQVRQVEIGLLFDPARKSEAHFCMQLKDKLQQHQADLNVQFNQPYLGTDDGFTTHLRSLYPDDQYLGIEIEINQKFLPQLKGIQKTLFLGIHNVLSR